MKRPIDSLTPGDWRALYPKLVKFAFTRTKSKARATDAAHDAIQRVIDPKWEPWDPATHPVLLDYLMSIVNRLVSNEKTSARVHREIAMASGEHSTAKEREAEHDAENVKDDARTPEALVVDADLKARALTRLRNRLERNDDALAVSVLEQIQGGSDDVSEMATALGVSEQEIGKARERVRHLARRVAEEMSHADEAPRDEAKEMT